mmetsp:Transcript_5464/g.12637  ORF Transcript_5464/g.12637 Transcript_5464/m.12637 type:complete len:94 (+) Transcript_5464:813-1094(+)
MEVFAPAKRSEAELSKLCAAAWLSAARPSMAEFAAASDALMSDNADASTVVTVKVVVVRVVELIDVVVAEMDVDEDVLIVYDTVTELDVRVLV